MRLVMRCSRSDISVVDDVKRACYVVRVWVSLSCVRVMIDSSARSRHQPRNPKFNHPKSEFTGLFASLC